MPIVPVRLVRAHRVHQQTRGDLGIYVGMTLVGLVLTKWAPHVPDRAFRVLLRMAMTALDEPNEKHPAETFFGSRDLLASVLRAERHGSIASIERAVERAISDLVAVGAIERINRAGNGKRAGYRLTLLGPIRIDGHAVDNHLNPSEQPDTSGGAEPDTSGQQPDTSGGAEPDTSGHCSPTPTVGPRRKEETREEEFKKQAEDESVDLREPVAVRARDETENDEAIPRCRNPNCFLGNVIDKTKPKGKRTVPCPDCNPPSNVIQFGRRRA